MQEALTPQEMEQSDTNPYDTHPSLKDRIAFLEKLPAQTMPVDDQPALALIGKYVAVLERELLGGAVRGRAGTGVPGNFLERHRGPGLYLPVWRGKVREYAKALSGLRLGALPDLAAYPEEFLAHFDFPPELSLEEQKALGRHSS